MTAEAIREHNVALQAIADANDGTRVAGLPGHDESAEYVAEQAEAAGLDVSFQEFTFEYALGDIGVPVLDVVGGKRYEPGLFGAFFGGDFGSQAFSPSGDVPAPLWAADLKLPSTGGSTSGCEAADYTGMPAGAVVLVQRGTCALVNKWRVAQAAIYGGAAGVAFDPCYHAACDTLGNLDMTALEQMADGAAHATLTLAMNSEAINGRRGKGSFRPESPAPDALPLAAGVR